MVETLNRLNECGFTSYPVSPHLAFALSNERVVIVTNLCIYLVTNDRLNSRAGHARIRRGIENREYKCIADVLTDMKLTPGVGVAYRMARLEEIL